jgi:hypothetical protein
MSLSPPAILIGISYSKGIFLVTSVIVVISHERIRPGGSLALLHFLAWTIYEWK